MDLPKPLSLRTMLALAIPGLVFIHIIFGRSEYLLVSHFFAMLLGVLALGVWYAYYAGRIYESRAPILEVFVGYQYSQYGIGVFLPQAPVSWLGTYPSTGSYEFASILAFFASLFSILGFGLAKRVVSSVRVDRLLPTLTVSGLEKFAMPYLICTAVVALFSRLVLLGPTAGVLEIVFSKQVNFALQFLLHIYFPSAQTRSRLLLAILLQFASFFFLSNLEELASVAAIAFVGWVWLKRRVPWRLTLLSILAFLLLQPAKGYYREYSWTGATGGFLRDEGSSIDAWEYAYDRMTHETKNERESAANPIGRLSELGSLAFTYETVPMIVPYQGNASTLESIGISWVPRLIWPAKPTNVELSSSRFTQILGLTTPEQDSWSATSFPIVHHAYLIDGLMGVLVWSALVGVLMRFYSTTLRASLYRFVIGLPFTIGFARNINIVNLFSSIWQQVVGWMIFGFLVVAIDRTVSRRPKGQTSFATEH